jgi:hypothetical protein
MSLLIGNKRRGGTGICADGSVEQNGTLIFDVSSGNTFFLVTKLDNVVNNGTWDGVDTLNFTSTKNWTRPDDWIAIPDVSASDELLYGIAPIYENANNLYAVAINNLAATTDWGDGSTPVVSNGSIQTKTYNYTTFVGDIKVSPDGRNYKQALVYIRRTGGAITSVDFYGATTSN